MGSLQRYNDYKKLKLPWLPDVPTHWELKRAKQLFKTIDVRSSTGQEELLSVSANFGVVKRADANVTMFKAVSYVGYKLCWPEDLAVNSLWAWQKGLGFSRHHGIISTAYSVYRLRNKQDFNYKYYDYYVRSSAYSWELRVRSKGIWRSRYQLLDVNFFDSPMICPPKEEQDQIVRYLDSKLAKINNFIRNKKRLIELLKEQKQALINHAVTKGLDPDAKMKPSGVEWLDVVPEGWSVLRVGMAYDVELGKMLQPDKKCPDETLEKYLCALNIFWDRISLNTVKEMWFSLKDKQKYEIKKGDLIVVEGGDVGVSCVWNGNLEPCYIQNAVHRVREKGTGFNKFLYYWLFCIKNLGAIDAICSKATFAHLTKEKLERLFLFLPPQHLQLMIIHHLDEITQTIDQTIDHINKEIDLITEYRTSLISAVVTGKVDVRGIAVEEPPVEDLAELAPAELEDEELREDDLLESEVG